MVSTFRDQLPPDVMDGEAAEYFLQMGRDLGDCFGAGSLFIGSIERFAFGVF